jgi:thioredoxin 1
MAHSALIATPPKDACMFPRRLLLIAALLVSTAATAAPRPYDETADASADVERALASAAATNKRVLLVFGANWCADCVALDGAMKAGRTAELVGKEFVVVKVDVGNFDRNLALAQQFGNPIKKGIPAAVLLAKDRQVLYATRAGELSNARRMSESGVYDFLKAMGEPAGAKK